MQLINNLIFLRINEILAKRRVKKHCSTLYYSVCLFLFLFLSYYPFFYLLSLLLSLFSLSLSLTKGEREGKLVARETRPVDSTS